MIETFIYSLIIGVAVGISAGYLGSLMVMKKMALVGDALSHVALPGIALGLYFGFDRFLGAFIFLFVAALIVWQVGRMTALSFESIIGAIFTLALAVGILLVPNSELLEALFGDISKVGLLDTVIALIISVAAILLTRLIYKKMVLGMISEDLAVSKGINVAVTNLLYLLLISMIVAVGIRITGTLLVGFLVIVPGVSGKNVSQNLSKFAMTSSIFGAVSAVAGITSSQLLNQTPGPMIVIAGIIIFAFTVAYRWRRR